MKIPSQSRNLRKRKLLWRENFTNFNNKKFTEYFKPHTDAAKPGRLLDELDRLIEDALVEDLLIKRTTARFCSCTELN